MPHSNTAIIDEATEQLAEYLGAIIADNSINKTARLSRLFEDYGDYLKANVSDEQRTNTIPDDEKVSGRLKDLASAMIVAEPTLTEKTAMFYLLHHPRGRALAREHLKPSISKHKEQIMPQIDIMKVIAITEQGLMAQVTKRDGESYAKSFSRKFENDIDFRKQWRDLTEAKHSMALDPVVLAKGMATLTPTSTEVGNTNFVDDSAEAVRLLQEMADKQHRTFEQVFTDPANKALAGRTYTAAHRPTASSTSGDELQ
ncbi:hypothetical protein SAMN05444321_1227 [Bradyrhizobium lablabi]|nr:hypothetical protein SAMN05444321_1227 [Bradyrhizobium lablabi]